MHIWTSQPVNAKLGCVDLHETRIMIVDISYAACLLVLLSNLQRLVQQPIPVAT